jgi:GNAT superfamily N-acetyltransferase
MGYELIEVRDPADWEAYHAIRRQELFEAKGRFGIYNPDHPDEYVRQAHPYLLKLDGVPIGTTRLDVREDGVAIFRMVAITASAQGRGHGRIMGQLVEDRARAFGTTTLYVNAAETALGFYHRTGWVDHAWDPAELVSLAVNATQMRKLL